MEANRTASDCGDELVRRVRSGFSLSARGSMVISFMVRSSRVLGRTRCPSLFVFLSKTSPEPRDRPAAAIVAEHARLADKRGLQPCAGRVPGTATGAIEETVGRWAGSAKQPFFASLIQPRYNPPHLCNYNPLFLFGFSLRPSLGVAIFRQKGDINSAGVKT